MKIIVMMTAILIIYLIAGADDVAVAKEEEKLCAAMVELFKASGGDIGWPQEVCE